MTLQNQVPALTLNSWLEKLPSKISWEVNTGELEEAMQSLLPNETEILDMLEKTGVPAQVTELQSTIEALPEHIQMIAESAEESMDIAIDTLQESMSGLVDRIEGLPEEFESALSEQLKESAEQILEAFKDDIEDHWKSLPTEAEDAMKYALTSGFQSFLDIADQAGTYFRDEVKDTLNQSEEQLKTHVSQQLTETKDELEVVAIESVEQELVTSQALLAVGSATTSALSPLLPYIKAADLAADQIKNLLEPL